MRARTVAGVQTCELPISRISRIRSFEARAAGTSRAPKLRIREIRAVRLKGGRSEERRVGKEWRSRCLGRLEEDRRQRQQGAVPVEHGAHAAGRLLDAVAP